MRCGISIIINNAYENACKSKKPLKILSFSTYIYGFKSRLAHQISTPCKHSVCKGFPLFATVFRLFSVSYL